MDLPADVQYEIASHLRSLRDLAHLCRTDRAWADLCRDPRFWSGLFRQARRLGREELAAEIGARIFMDPSGYTQAIREEAGGLALVHLPHLWARGIAWDSPIVQAKIATLAPSEALVGWRSRDGHAAGIARTPVQFPDRTTDGGDWFTGPILVLTPRPPQASDRWWVAYAPAAEGASTVQASGTDFRLEGPEGARGDVNTWHTMGHGADAVGVTIVLMRRAPARRSRSRSPDARDPRRRRL